MTFTKRTSGTRYAVEWIPTEPPKDECGDWLHDEAEVQRRCYADRATAESQLRRVAPDDVYGCARMHIEEVQFAFNCERNGDIYEWETTHSFEIHDGELAEY